MTHTVQICASKTAHQYDYGPYHYDGVSEWHCKHGRFGRWCGKQLEGNEVEPPFCKGEIHPQVPRS